MQIPYKNSQSQQKLHNGVKKIIAFSIPFLVPVITLAASGTATLENPLRFDTLYEFLIELLNVVIAIAFPALVLFFVWIGFKFISAQGNAEELKKVRGLFLWAVVGALLVLGARVLAEAIRATVQELRT